MEIRITIDSFGDTCPANWEEIANYLNEIIDKYAEETSDEIEFRERCDSLWETYCAGELDGAPVPVGVWEDNE